MKQKTLTALVAFIVALAVNASANSMQNNLSLFQNAQDLNLENDAAFGLYYEKDCDIRTEKVCSVLNVSKLRIVEETLDISMLSDEELKKDLTDREVLFEIVWPLTSAEFGSASAFSAPKRMKSGKFKGAMYSVNLSNFIEWLLPVQVVRGDKVLVRKLNDNEIIAIGTEGSSNKAKSATRFERLR